MILSLPSYSLSPTLKVPIAFRASSNESSAAPSSVVAEAISSAALEGNRYPRPYGDELIATLAIHFRLDATEIAVDGGSHSLLNSLLLAYAGEGARVIYAWRSFEAYPISVASTGATPVAVPNRPDGSHDLDSMISQIDTSTRVVILCNPNNPTGTAFGRRELVDFLERTPDSTLVILDEAYVQFLPHGSTRSSGTVALLGKYANLAILRTFSKYYALAGMRVGFLLAHPAVVTAVRSVQPTFPLSQPAIAAAIAALEEDGSARDRVLARVIEQREAIKRMLDERGYPCIASSANFVWLPLGKSSAEFAEVCGRSGILVRRFGDEGVRITVGEPGIVEAIAAALDSSIR